MYGTYVFVWKYVRVRTKGDFSTSFLQRLGTRKQRTTMGSGSSFMRRDHDEDDLDYNTDSDGVMQRIPNEV